MNKTELFNKFISHVVISKYNEFNEYKLDDVVEQSFSKLLVEFADRPIALMYKHFLDILSGELITYCTPNTFNRIMEMISHELISFQSVAFEIVAQLLSDYDYMDDIFMYQYSTYLAVIGKTYLNPTVY